MNSTVELAGIEQARRLGHSWVGWQHMLLALLAGDARDPARQALEACGVTLDALESRFLSSQTNSDSSVEAGIRPNAHCYTLMGRAEGLALGSGASNIRPVDVLIGLLWDGMVGTLDILQEVGITRIAIRDALQALGVDVPPVPLPEQTAGPISQRVDVPLSDADAVIQILTVRHPPGTEVWGFNHDGGQAWFFAEDRIDLQGIVDEALEPPTESGSPS